VPSFQTQILLSFGQNCLDLKINSEPETCGLQMLDLNLGSWGVWYKKVWAAIYLAPTDARVLENFIFWNLKIPWWVLVWQSLKFLPLEACHTFKIKITYTPLKYAASTLEVRNNMPLDPPNIFFPPTLGENTTHMSYGIFVTYPYIS
jgi:hypothetical protein